MISAKWGNKTFVVEPKKIRTPKDISFGESVDLEETDNTGRKPSVAVKKINLMDVSFTVMLNNIFLPQGVIFEIRDWQTLLLNKNAQDLQVGRYYLGKFFLKSYKVSDLTINKDGEYVKATLTLDFVEDKPEKRYKFALVGSLTEQEKKVEQVKQQETMVRSKQKVREGSFVKIASSYTAHYSYWQDAVSKKNPKSSKLSTKWEYEVIQIHTTGSANSAGGIDYYLSLALDGVGLAAWVHLSDVDVVKY